MILDRHEAIEANQDPLGRVWGIRKYNKDNSFWAVCVRNPAGELVIPPKAPHDMCEGLFTKVVLAEHALKTYLNDAWDESDERAKYAPGKERAKKVREEESQAA